MIIRQFDWRDFPTLLRYRNRGLFFDSASILTRGVVIVSTRAVLSYFAPTIGIYTYLCVDEDNNFERLMGQISHTQGDQLARLTFLAPESSLDTDALHSLLEYIIQKIGERGAFHLMAEVDERTTTFENLRKDGFALYVRQRIWQCEGDDEHNPEPSHWREISKQDVIAVRSLYNTLVPPLVQQVESLPTDQMKGLVYYQDDELLAYAEVKYGQRGIWVHPFIHPDTEDVAERLEDLLHNIPNRHSRSIYMCVRSYQSWIEHSLEDMQAEAGPLQAVMVKHLAIAKKVGNTFTLPALEGGQQEITTPFMRSEGTKIVNGTK
jgi:hypothetical protein